MRKQINNIKIKYSDISKKYQCISPSKVVLEEFEERDNAENWARDTKDFIIK